MIKRIFLLISISLVTVLSAHADRTFTFNLNADKMSDTKIHPGLCSVTAKVDDNGKLVVRLKNISEEGYSLHLFKHEFSKKQLKNRKISVAKGLSSLLNYDRTYHLDDFAEDNYKIDVDDSKNIIEVSVPDTSLTYKLPVYVSVKVKKGFLFWKKTVNEIRNLENLKLEININLEKKLSEEVLRLGDECDELISDINKASICNKTGNHSDGWTSKKDWENKIKKLKQSINELKDNNNGWYDTHRDARYCNDLNDKLDKIELTTSNCPKHKGGGTAIPTHGCKYCKMSMEEINTQIRKIYNNMRNSNNHQKIKEEHMKEVQDMYKCSTSSKRSKAQNANIRDRIKRAYEEFINY